STPGRRGRKRKQPPQQAAGGSQKQGSVAGTSATATTTATTASGRPKRAVVPNIKSEFVYDTVTDEGDAPGDGYHYVEEEGGVITAWQATDEDAEAADSKNDESTEADEEN